MLSQYALDELTTGLFRFAVSVVVVHGAGAGHDDRKAWGRGETR